MNHIYLTCEGCGKKQKKSAIVWFLGHYLCHHCKIRSNMPLVGYKNRIAWQKHESKLYKKKRNIPYLTGTERNYLYNQYTKMGIPYSEIKKRYAVINGQLIRVWNKNNTKSEVKDEQRDTKKA